MIEIIGHGFNPNAGTLIDGAIVDLEGFEAVVVEAADARDKIHTSHDRKFWLAIHNRDYDDDAIEHYTESAGEDGYTAGEVLKAYVEARRATGAWEKLATHPRRESLIWEWLQSVTRDEGVLQSSEIEALGDAARDHRHEASFWAFTAEQFDKSLLVQLESRLRHGSNDRRLRTNAALTALRHASSLIDGLLAPASSLSVERMLELAMDIRDALEGEEKTVSEQRAIIANHTTGIVEETVEAIHQVLGFGDTSASLEVLDVLQSVPVSAHPDLNLATAQALARNGIDVSNRIKTILAAEYEVSDENIDLVVQAMGLAIRLGYFSLQSVGLNHEFALCRIAAMDAIFATASQSLPASLLSMRQDASSLVRKRLVEMLEETPHGDHTEALIDLTFDTWTPDQHHHGYPVAYPIAEKASKLLLEQPKLTDTNYKRVIEALKNTDNDDVRLLLLRVMVRHGSSAWRKKLVQISVGEGRPRYELLTAQAMFLEAGHLEDEQVDVVDDEAIASVSPSVACWLVLVLISRSVDQRIEQLGKTLATNPDRAVLNALTFLVALAEARVGLREAIGKLLSDDIRAAISEVFETRDASQLDYLDTLGDVRMVEQVKDFFRKVLN